MTINQFLNLLAVLAWPTVAFIASVAFVHGCRLLLEAHVLRTKQLEYLQRAVTNIHGYWSAVYNERRQDELHSAPRLDRTCEQAMLNVLQYHGRFPGVDGGDGDETGRVIVRQFRAMYDEIEEATPAPERKPRAQATGDDVADPLDYDDDPEVAEFFPDPDAL